MITSTFDALPGVASPCSGLDLFRACQEFARARYGSSQGQGMLPGGARIFYFTRLRLLRLGVSPTVEPDTTPLPDEVAQRFMQEAPQIAARLAADFRRALRLLQQPEARLWRVLAGSAFLSASELPWAPEHMQGTWLMLNQTWRQFWARYWKAAVQARREELLSLLRPDRLLVTVVARPSDSDEVALALLRERLARDRFTREAAPPAEVYLYDEPLANWLLRPVLTGAQLLDFCEAFARWTGQIPGMVQRRILLVEQDALRSASEISSAHLSSSQEREHPDFLQARGTLEGVDDVPGAMRRRMPLIPNGVVTAESLFYFSTLLWRRSGETDRSRAITPDDTLIAPDTFRAVITLALRVVEHLLWDEPQAVLAQASKPGGLLPALHEALLPGRLRQEYRTLLSKSRVYADTRLLDLPPWEVWETMLSAAASALEARLATTLVPASITRERLDALLQEPLPPPGEPYLYDRPFGAWCRTALPAQMPSGRHLLAFCQSLAEALGDWPAGVAGAPASPEAAARAICWFTKLALEARIRPAVLREATSARSLPLPQSPQRADGGLAVWLDDVLPAAALSLAAVIAPRAAVVLYRMVWRAARRSQPLLLAQLKMGDPESWAGMERFLQQRARFLGHPDPDQAAWEAAEKLHTHVLHLILPADVSEALLAGDRQLLGAPGWFDGYWYLHQQSAYQCLADPLAFARSFIRLPQRVLRVPVETLPTELLPEDDTFEHPPLEEQDARAALELINDFGKTHPSGTTTEQAAGHQQTDQAIVLRLLQSTPTARSIIHTLARQRVPAARSIQQRWEAWASGPDQNDQRDEGSLAAQGREAAEVALARLFSERRVATSPQVRGALADMFEMPLKQDHQRRSIHLPVGVLERASALAFRPAQRAAVLEALEALGQLARKQQMMICKRLLKREEVALLLTLLETSGWRRPAWLQADPEAGASLQLLHIGRVNWLKHVTDAHTPRAWHARGMINEWLGLHFWSSLWQRSEQAQALSFYQMTLAALPESLRLVVGGVWRLALKEHLASLPEILGVAGALPPQLPVQLDSPAFFSALRDLLLDLPTWRARQEDSLASEDDLLIAHQLRRQLQAARCRIAAWMYAISGLERDHEYKALLAAAALANGKPERLERWLGGIAPSREECSAMCQQIRQWHHQVTIAPEELPDYLHAAGRQLAPFWVRLRRDI